MSTFVSVSRSGVSRSTRSQVASSLWCCRARVCYLRSAASGAAGSKFVPRGSRTPVSCIFESGFVVSRTGSRIARARSIRTRRTRPRTNSITIGLLTVVGLTSRRSRCRWGPPWLCSAVTGRYTRSGRRCGRLLRLRRWRIWFRHCTANRCRRVGRGAFGHRRFYRRAFGRSRLR